MCEYFSGRLICAGFLLRNICGQQHGILRGAEACHSAAEPGPFSYCLSGNRSSLFFVLDGKKSSFIQRKPDYESCFCGKGVFGAYLAERQLQEVFHPVYDFLNSRIYSYPAIFVQIGISVLAGILISNLVKRISLIGRLIQRHGSKEKQYINGCYLSRRYGKLDINVKKYFDREKILQRSFGLLFCLTPLISAILFCMMDGKMITDIYIPLGGWSDEITYYKQIEGILSHGMPRGYFGYNQSKALYGSLSVWGLVPLIPYVIWGKIFGWNYCSPIFANIFLAY